MILKKLAPNRSSKSDLPSVVIVPVVLMPMPKRHSWQRLLLDQENFQSDNFHIKTRPSPPGDHLEGKSDVESHLKVDIGLTWFDNSLTVYDCFKYLKSSCFGQWLEGSETSGLNGQWLALPRCRKGTGRRGNSQSSDQRKQSHWLLGAWWSLT